MVGRSFDSAVHIDNSKHAKKPGLVTVAGKPGDNVAPGTLNSILKQATLKP
jgi:predicted RNA binding protein YcfA (HicA-like mRNA interferase family)